ncbi:M16 family metallopeptidase [Thalassotalea sp. PS06]|uniref:M16 family metallopeptidase n=1 Tax=Thalassotalea sp. PS06 TaxID=2594005 RepID=UPI001162C841|nr:pitrilysin family protein [Thalassotalea sp. PS06]QDP00540.1 insulinase family protein [Thalassotalea sp. PS06]
MIFKKNFYFCLAFSTVVFGCSSVDDKASTQTSPSVNQTQNLPKHTLEYVRNVEGIDEYMLSNGLKVLLFKDDSQPKTLVNITYRVGSVHEKYGETGMAHLLEHMLFKGSTNYQQIDKEFKKRGMASNANTWYDRTSYFESFEANEDSLNWALGMEADRMINATFTEEQLKSEMTVVRNEMERNENSPSRILMARLASVANLWHNYANSTIGARSDVENFPFPKLREFYKTHYRIDNATLIVAGRFDTDKTKARIEETFGAIDQPEKPVEELYTREPTQDGERVVNLRRTGDVPFLGLYYHGPSGLDPDAAPLQVLQVILADGSRGRIKKDLVDTGLTSGGTQVSFFLKEGSQILFLVQGEKGQNIEKLKPLENGLIKLAENIENKPITQEEVDFAKALLAKQVEQDMRNATGVGMALAEYIAKGDYRYMFYFRDLVEQVTVEQVQAVAEKYLISSNRTLGRFLPTENPQRAEIAKVPVASEILGDYVGREAVVAGEVYDNSVENIKARLYTQTWESGTKVSVYPKKLRGEEVLIRMFFPNADADALTGQATAMGLIGSQIKAGNAKYTKSEIADRLDQLKSSLSFGSNAVGEFSINIKTDVNNMPAVIDFMGELLAEPSFPEKELNITKKGMIAGLNQSRTEPGTVALNSYRESLFDYPKGHPKAYMTIDEQIEAIRAIDSAKLEKLYKQFFAINHGHIAVVGDVNSEAVSEHLLAVLNPYTSDMDYQYIPINLKDEQGLVVSSETPDKANASVYMINPIKIKSTDDDYPALYIANSIFGGDPFTSRIGARIRVKEGYSYSVGSGLQASTQDDTGVFYATAISAPENMENVIKAYQEEIAKVVNEGFTDEEVQTAIDGYLSSRKRQWASDAYVAGVLIDASEEQRDLSYYDERAAEYKQLTTEDVNAAFKKYIASQQPNVFKAGDFAKLAK